jgi:F-type H+-transporting ATPase subunit b
MNAITQFAEASTGSTDVFSAIGFDWKMLLFQIIGFVILVWLMSKYVYPPLLKTIDERQAKIEAGNKAATTAEKKAAETKEEMAKMLREARREASEIVSTAKEEANAAIEAADAKSKVRTERLLSEAHAQVEKDIASARKTLHNETLSLVALATEKVVGATVSAKVDDDIIATAVKEAR